MREMCGAGTIVHRQIITGIHYHVDISVITAVGWLKVDQPSRLRFVKGRTAASLIEFGLQHLRQWNGAIDV